MIAAEPKDVPSLIMDWLAVDLAARFPTLKVALELDSQWALHSSPPMLIVEDDGDPLVIWPVGTSPTTRITSWTTGRDRRYVHAALTRLLTTPIPGIAKVLPGTGILDARDPTTGGDLASFTVRARARLAVPQ